jgi:hypothetical protein
VQISPLPTSAPDDRGRGSDRASETTETDRKDAERSREPSRLVPSVKIPQIPGGLGKKDR